MLEVPVLTKGSIAADDRGELSFVNEFSPAGMKRFYIVRNYKRDFVRAWHGHKQEFKAALVLTGAAIVAAVKIDDLVDLTEGGNTDTSKVRRFVMSANTPAVLLIPPGWANGFKSLTDDTAIMYFSSSTIEEAKKDDFRFPKNLFGSVWDVIER
jgi:dTDP-4-dehydrorhamnose 3,5-epimerase